MQRPSRQAAVIALSLVLGGASLVIGGTWGWRLIAPDDRVVEAGFWFGPIAFEAPSLGGALSPADLRTVEAVARAEIARAFSGLRIRLTSRETARYRIEVVEHLQDPRFRRPIEVAGASRAISGLGGGGAVSFTFIANGAIAYAPPGAERAVVIEAIGTGIGRTAVHELTHQLLPAAPIHDSSDIASFEYASAARREQYFGPMRWNLAWPMLVERLGRTPPATTGIVTSDTPD